MGSTAAAAASRAGVVGCWRSAGHRPGLGSSCKDRVNTRGAEDETGTGTALKVEGYLGDRVMEVLEGGPEALQWGGST